MLTDIGAFRETFSDYGRHRCVSENLLCILAAISALGSNLRLLSDVIEFVGTIVDASRNQCVWRNCCGYYLTSVRLGDIFGFYLAPARLGILRILADGSAFGELLRILSEIGAFKKRRGL